MGDTQKMFRRSRQQIFEEDRTFQKKLRIYTRKIKLLLQRQVGQLKSAAKVAFGYTVEPNKDAAAKFVEGLEDTEYGKALKKMQ